MTPAFADTYYYLALSNPADAGHAKAVAYAQSTTRPIVTTAWVVTETADAMCKVGSRGVFVQLLADLKSPPQVNVVPADQALMDRGIDLYINRFDKDWSLTDCISFVVMDEMGLTDALTADHHFEQAGFNPLL